MSVCCFQMWKLRRSRRTRDVIFLTYIFSADISFRRSRFFRWNNVSNDQLFAKTAVAVHIVEEYMLSGQYTAEALMNEYRESIILEIERKKYACI